MMNLHSHNASPEEKQRSWKLVGLGVLLCLVAFTAGVVVMKVVSSSPGFYSVADDWNSQTTDQDIPTQVAVDEPTLTIPNPDGPALEGIPLIIDWVAPEKQRQVVFDARLFEALCHPYATTTSFSEGTEAISSYCSSFDRAGRAGAIPDVNAYFLGTVRGGTFDGWYLEMDTVAQSDMMTVWRSFYFLKDSNGDENPILLGRYARSVGSSPSQSTSAEIIGWAFSDGIPDWLTLNSELIIPDFEKELQLIDMRGRLFRFNRYWMRYDNIQAQGIDITQGSTLLPDGRTLFLYRQLKEDGTPVVYNATLQGSDEFYLIDEDGRVVWYELEIPFWDYEGLSHGQAVPNIEWNDGTKNTITYLKGQVGGCGFTKSTNVLTKSQMSKLPSMKLVGTGLGMKGETYQIFEPSSYDNVYYTEGFNALSIEFTQFQEGEKKTFADIAHPYVYYQDSFDRWVEMMNNEIIPPVECGKPVIYLYPQEPTDLSVTMDLDGGFSYTEPEYGTGWNVTAYPDGHLVNKADGKTYPYLFWEGRGGSYQPPSTYWVVEQKNVESFLERTLTQMNLNKTEVVDFVEFWLPRMQGSPYYQVGFHGTEVMDVLAPLSLSVQPDHIFRVLMDYVPLETIQPSRPPVRLPKANRDGFDVLEWGGVLR